MQKGKVLTISFPIPNFDENTARILPVLMYHVPERDMLEKQFQWIKDNSYEPVHLNEVVNYLLYPTSVTFPSKKIVLTFDDAYQKFLFNVSPLLSPNRFDFKVTICVPTDDSTAKR